MWLEESCKHFGDNTTVDRKLVLDFLSHSLYQQGDVNGALKVTEQWLQIDPKNSRALHNRRHYQRAAVEKGRHTPASDKFVNKRTLDNFRSTTEFKNYEKLCRGQRTHIDVSASQLSCRYVAHDPSLFLRPGKEERIRIDPPIFLYHDVVTATERDTIKQLAAAKFRSSKVVPHVGFDSGKYDARSSKTAWLQDSVDFRVARMSRKARVLSNLTLDTAEEFQVLNYGIGGHYVTHNDNLMPKDVKPSTGNRISTFLCYLSTVRAGGATVFPNIGVSVPPEEGSCVFWHNLLPNGEGDVRTRHASCPVLIGNKWAVNKWFRERGQEFARPCTPRNATRA
jgi:prolyl 4-hydroxylase